MLIAVMADMHANRQAFSACLNDARGRGVERFALLGDFVGYGADPCWCVDTARTLVAEGAVAVLGNHDCAVGDPTIRLNAEAQVAIEWTRGQLDTAQRAFLASLPMTVRDEDRLFVHAEASSPRRWFYVSGADAAIRSLKSVDAPITFCGHIHRPAIYSLSVTAKLTAFEPIAGAAVPLSPHRRWLVVVGSVGQPRDGTPAASYAVLDTTTHEITYQRVPYDVASAAEAIRRNNLPPRFADRLFAGK